MDSSNPSESPKSSKLPLPSEVLSHLRSHGGLSRLSDRIYKSVMAAYPDFVEEVRAVGRNSFREVYGNVEARNPKEAYVAVKSGIEKSRVVIEALEMVKSEARSERIRLLFAEEVQGAVQEIKRLNGERKERKKADERKAEKNNDAELFNGTSEIQKKESNEKKHVLQDLNGVKVGEDREDADIKRNEENENANGRQTPEKQKDAEPRANEDHLVTDFVEEIIYKVLTDVCKSSEEDGHENASHSSILLADLLKDLGVRSAKKKGMTEPAKKGGLDALLEGKTDQNVVSYKSDTRGVDAYSVSQNGKSRETNPGKEMVPPGKAQSERDERPSSMGGEGKNTKEVQEADTDVKVADSSNENKLGDTKSDEGKAARKGDEKKKLTKGRGKRSTEQSEVAGASSLDKNKKEKGKTKASDNGRSRNAAKEDHVSDDGKTSGSDNGSEESNGSEPNNTGTSPAKLGRGKRKKRPSVHLQGVGEEADLSRNERKPRTPRSEKARGGSPESGEEPVRRKKRKQETNTEVEDDDPPKKRVRRQSEKKGAAAPIAKDESEEQEWDKNGLVQMKKCVTRLMQLRHAWPFLVPVDPVELGIPDYFEVIKKPMDLGTISGWLENLEKKSTSHYKSVDEVISDVKLVWDNCLKYNKPKDKVHDSALAMQSSFDKMLKRFEKHEKVNTAEKPVHTTPRKSKDVQGAAAIGGMCLAFGKIDEQGSHSGWHKGKVLGYNAEDHSYEIEWEMSGERAWYKFPSKQLSQLRLVAKK